MKTSFFQFTDLLCQLRITSTDNSFQVVNPALWLLYQIQSLNFNVVECLQLLRETLITNHLAWLFHIIKTVIYNIYYKLQIWDRINYSIFLSYLNTRLYTKIITFLVMLKIKWTNFSVWCEKLQALGLGLLIAGILVKINALSSDVTPALNSVEVAGYKLGDLANNLSIVFIVIGAFIVLVSGLGLIGGCCEVRWMLVVVLI